jgi:hypothetical protein
MQGREMEHGMQLYQRMVEMMPFIKQCRDPHALVQIESHLKGLEAIQRRLLLIQRKNAYMAMLENATPPIPPQYPSSTETEDIVLLQWTREFDCDEATQAELLRYLSAITLPDHFTGDRGWRVCLFVSTQ